MSLSVVVLAAGKGTRMKNNLPKVLHPIAGLPMLSHVLRSSLKLGASKIITVIGEAMDDVKKTAEKYDSSVVCVIQNPAQGTGDAVKFALPQLHGAVGDVLVQYGDTPFISEHTLKKLLQEKRESGASVAVLGFKPSDPAQYGRLVVEGKSLKKIVEFKDASDEERKITLCNSGVMAIDAQHIHNLIGAIKNNNSKGEYYLTDVVEIALQNGLSATYTQAEEFEVMGINSQSERAEAEKLFQNRIRAEMLEKGVILIAPETVFFSADTKLASGVVVHPFVTFHGKVVVEEGVEIKSFCHIEGAVLRKNCIVGPYARIRPGSELKEDVHIGNFVEVKNSVLHEGVKAGHLSYLGDAEIGAETNIGAGTITCNYDGKNKHKTNLGKNVFVGSNTSLVAPVSVGDNAVIGAGATIYNNVDAGKLAINKMPQEIREKK